MTPTATYIAEENCLQEQLPPELDPATHDANAHPDLYDEYKACVATLRKIPCDPSCKGLWADGQKLVEGKDYEVRRIRRILRPSEMITYDDTAFPLVPVKSEDEEKKMWMDAITLAMNALADDPFTPGKWLEVVKSKYSLTKR